MCGYRGENLIDRSLASDVAGHDDFRTYTGRGGVLLGLHIVQTLCEGAGYRLNIRSVPGRGSIFSVLIPT